MNMIQAEMKARSFNALPHMSLLSYIAHPMAPTKWEKDRWGVVQCYGTQPYPLNIVGIAAT